MITVDDKVGFLRVLFWDAEDAGLSLFQVVKAIMREQHAGGSTQGGYVTASSGNGRSTQFAMPDFYKTLTRDDARHLMNQLMTGIQNASQCLGIQFPPEDGDVSNNQAVFLSILKSDWARKVTSSYNDWTNLRLSPLDRDCALLPGGVVSW